MLKGDRSDIIVLLITFFLTVLVDLTVAIEVGLLMAIILFVKRVSETSSITVLESDYLAATENEEKAVLESVEQLNVPKGVEIFEIDGPFFFGLASKLDELDRQTKEDILRVRIIRMRKVPFIDSTGINNLRSLYLRSKKSGIQVILSGVQDDVLDTIEKFGLLHEIGQEYVFSHIIPALAKATEMVSVAETYEE